jgi:hypothetical protein
MPLDHRRHEGTNFWGSRSAHFAGVLIHVNSVRTSRRHKNRRRGISRNCESRRFEIYLLLNFFERERRRGSWRNLAQIPIPPRDDFFFKSERRAREAHHRNNNSSCDPDREMHPENCLAEPSAHGFNCARTQRGPLPARC